MHSNGVSEAVAVRHLPELALGGHVEDQQPVSVAASATHQVNAPTTSTPTTRTSQPPHPACSPRRFDDGIISRHKRAVMLRGPPPGVRYYVRNYRVPATALEMGQRRSCLPLRRAPSTRSDDQLSGRSSGGYERPSDASRQSSRGNSSSSTFLPRWRAPASRRHWQRCCLPVTTLVNHRVALMGGSGLLRCV